MATAISEIVRAHLAIASDAAVRSAHYLDTTPELWSGLRADYEIEMAPPPRHATRQDAAPR